MHRRKPKECVQGVRCPLRGDLYHSCHNWCLHDSSTWPVGRKRMRNDQSICAHSTLKKRTTMPEKSKPALLVCYAIQWQALRIVVALVAVVALLSPHVVCAQ